jgi:hypothetical protein
MRILDAFRLDGAGRQLVSIRAVTRHRYRPGPDSDLTQR